MKKLFAYISVFQLFILMNFSVTLNAQEKIEIFPNIASQKKLKFCLDITSSVIVNRMGLIDSLIDKYEIDIVKTHISTDNFLSYKDYPLLEKKVDQDYINRYRSYFQKLKEKGVYLVLGGNEPILPTNLLEKYPEMKDIYNWKLWKFIEDKTKELFDVIPEMDFYYIYLWETPTINSDIQFQDFRTRTNLNKYPYYSDADYLKYLMDAYSKAAHSRNKNFMIMSHSHFPYQEQIMIEACKETDKNYPFIIQYKHGAGDFSPFQPFSNVLLSITDREGHFMFDGAGEYVGNSLVPYCFPEEIQANVQKALTSNPGISTLVMRTHWGPNILFDTPNEVNFYTLYRLAEDPFTPVETIWDDWVTERFGPKAKEKVISALKRSDEIGKKIFFVDGLRAFNHSKFADLPYTESRFVNLAKSNARWKPYDVMGNYRANELLNYPREYLIKEIHADRDEALRLINLSLKDIEDVKKELRPEDYKLLKDQFTRQKDLANVSKLHLEAFFRYRIEKTGAMEKGEENRRKLELCLNDMEKMAVEIEKEKRGFLLLEPAMIRKYINDVRLEINKYN